MIRMLSTLFTKMQRKPKRGESATPATTGYVEDLFAGKRPYDATMERDYLFAASAIMTFPVATFAASAIMTFPVATEVELEGGVIGDEEERELLPDNREILF